MHIILLKNVEGVGMRGDAKEVADGYARNVLIRKGLAAPASETLLFEAKHMRKAKEQKVSLNREASAHLAGAINKMRVEIAAKANEQGELYAAVSEVQIAEALLGAGHRVSQKSIRFKAPIKHVGEHIVPISLPNSEKTSIVLSVSAK